MEPSLISDHEQQNWHPSNDNRRKHHWYPKPLYAGLLEKNCLSDHEKQVIHQIVKKLLFQDNNNNNNNIDFIYTESREKAFVARSQAVLEDVFVSLS